jgi:hypothetical protein
VRSARALPRPRTVGAQSAKVHLPKVETERIQGDGADISWMGISLVDFEPLNAAYAPIWQKLRGIPQRRGLTGELFAQTSYLMIRVGVLMNFWFVPVRWPYAEEPRN